MLNEDYTAKLLNLEDVIITNDENISDCSIAEVNATPQIKSIASYVRGGYHRREDKKMECGGDYGSQAGFIHSEISKTGCKVNVKVIPYSPLLLRMYPVRFRSWQPGHPLPSAGCPSSFQGLRQCQHRRNCRREYRQYGLSFRPSEALRQDSPSLLH